MSAASKPARLDRIVDLILGRRWSTVALATAVMLLMTGGARFITTTNDYRMMFSEDNPELVAFDALEQTYSESNKALIAIAPGDGTVFSREALGAIEQLTEAAWQAPYSSRVDSLTNYSHSEAVGDDLTVEPLVDGAGALSDAELANVEAIALDSIETAGRLVSEDGRVGAVSINFFLPDELDAAVVEITDYLNATLDGGRDHRLPERHAGRGSRQPSGHRLLPDRRRGHEPRLCRRDPGRPAPAHADRLRRNRRGTMPLPCS